MDLFSKKYATTDEALKNIRQTLEAYYQTKHPQIYAMSRPKIDSAVRELSRLYSQNLFPEMKTRWDTHPNNLGHLISAGCFRCHDDQHRSAEGKVVTRDCRACHTIVEQGPEGAVEKNIDGLDFKHPAGGDEWKDMDCADCHTGGAS